MLFERIKLEDDEKVIAVIRKHWWIVTVQTAVITSFAFVPYAVTSLVLALRPGDELLDYSIITSLLASSQSEITFLYAGWLLLLWIALANYWTDYYLDLWMVTSRRVILVDQRGFFRRFISSFRLERLQDMNIKVDGILATLLDYGTIEAQTAGGSNEEFTSPYMPKPREIKSLIVNAADDLNKQQRSIIDNLANQGL